MTTVGLEERLERGEIEAFEPCPFPLPTGDDLAFLMQQQIRGAAHKNISYNPASGIASGFVPHSSQQSERLRFLLSEFSKSASAWLASVLPRYAVSWQLDRATLRPEEEATRKLRLTARNDLLHFDAFPSRPTRGQRILRLYVNINPSDDRVWATSDTFAKVLQTFGASVGLPTLGPSGLVHRLGQGLLGIFQPNVLERTDYDEFMLRLHHFLKSNDEFQERAPRKLWHFKAGAAWLLFADAVSHAELRGQFALEHSYFVPRSALKWPDESPAALLQQMCGVSIVPNAA